MADFLSVFKRRQFRFLPLIISFTLAIVMASYGGVISAGSTEILWDTYGVPHIYGKDTQSAFQAFGWAQMQSHGDLLLRLYGQARGQAAQYWGEEYLESDRWVQTMGVPERARSWYKLQSPAFRNYLDAFAAGINAYAQEHSELIDDEVAVVLPVKAEDVLAHLHRVLHFTFVVNPGSVAGISQQESKAGSNGWAIAPSRSENGHAMLLANPHLPWSDLFLWYEAQMTAPGFNAYGATLVGIPVLAIAFNDHLGWTHTVNTHDGWDAYKLELVDNGYRFDGQVKSFETTNLSLKVKQPDGTFKTEPLVVKHSVHGPIISETSNEAVALRVVGLDEPQVLAQWWDMARAKNLAQFESALKRLQLPMFTVIYADKDGHIMHLFNGQVPIRKQGDFQYWQGIIPGNTSDTLWTKNHPYQDLPRIVDPKSGWLQNANDPPWTTTFPTAINADKYPPYMAPKFMDFRAQRSARMLFEDEKITFDEMVAYKHSTRMELADRILDDLILAARKQGSELAKDAANVLSAWDMKANANSKGAVLFATWVKQIDLEKAFSTPWSEHKPRTTPDGLADPQAAVAKLEAAASGVQETYGKLDVAWGEVFQIDYGDINLPANGGSDPLGIFPTLWFRPQSNGTFKSVGGDSFVAAVEFSQPVRAMVLNSYGNATQPGSRHVGDQLQMFANQQLRPAWLKRSDILDHLEARQAF
ncbi:acylase [Nodularia sp. NIES-3585]|uniref:acylase n=1 Tax=Nodularia sp. NIES-3585 TaxID=1973477 RepID=UPI0020CC7B96|nr:acylase [Nodularia sp. NIES-3585]